MQILVLFFAYLNFFVVSLQRLLISKPFSYSGQPFQESSQKFTIFKIASQLSSQPFSVLVTIFVLRSTFFSFSQGLVNLNILVRD